MKHLGVVAGLICIGAGVYMLLTQTQAQNSVFDVLLHGIGAYFVGKGLFVIVAARSQVSSEQSLRLIAQITADQRYGDAGHTAKTGGR